MELEESIEQILKEDTAQSRAVKTLVEIKPKTKTGWSDVEVKTDLNQKETCIHTSANMIQKFIKCNNFEDLDIIDLLVELKERKLLSLKRKSRGEIVDVAKRPDIKNTSTPDNYFKKMFTSQKGK